MGKIDELKVSPRFTNPVQEAAHYDRLSKFWAYEAACARQYEGEASAIAKIFADGAAHARDLSEHWRSKVGD